MPRKTIKERLEARYIPEPNSGCWIWLGPTTRSRVGWQRERAKLSVGRGTQVAARLSYSAYIGEIPTGLWVLHKCDTGLCINPSHLYVGTRLQNIQDMVSRGRHRHGTRKTAA